MVAKATEDASCHISVGASVRLQIYFLLGHLLALEVPFKVVEEEFENDYIMRILSFQELTLHCIWAKLAEKYPCFKNELYFPVKKVICYNHCRSLGKGRLAYKEGEEA